jgi:hypothetical protein
MDSTVSKENSMKILVKVLLCVTLTEFFFFAKIYYFINVLFPWIMFFYFYILHVYILTLYIYTFTLDHWLCI